MYSSSYGLRFIFAVLPYPSYSLMGLYIDLHLFK